MSLITQAPKGTQDITDCAPWQALEATLRAVAHSFGFSEIRAPIFEHTELFERGVGDTTDVVQKEMYTFIDKGGRSLSLRPEGTAGVCRAAVENSLPAKGLPCKLYYIGPNFRYERPQAGRWRQHHQFGVECLGPSGADADAEVIALAHMYLLKLGIRGVTLEINSIGCPDCRPVYHAALKKYISSLPVCALCKERSERNPLRVLDCKNPDCKTLTEKAPRSLEALCAPCAEHFISLRRYIDLMGISYTVNPMLVRGLDYYTHTVFEFKAPGLGSQDTVCGGGRYNGLIEALGGPPTPALGFGSGMERLLMTAEAQGIRLGTPPKPELYLCCAGTVDTAVAVGLTQWLRVLGINTERDIMNRSLKAQMKQADKSGAGFVCVIGDEEVESKTVRIKNLRSGEQIECGLDAEAIMKVVRK
jgi:histidyl-tRNA synthetase